MAMKMEKVAAIPTGTHTGRILRSEEKSIDFKGGNGPEPCVELEIQPDWSMEGHRTLPVSAVFSAVLTSLSALGKLLPRLGVKLEEGQDFNPRDLEGLEVAFEATRKPDGFVVLKKDSIRLNKNQGKF